MQLQAGSGNSPISAVAVLLFLATPGLATAQQYIVEDLGTLGGDLSAALDIDERGFVVGASRITGSTNLHAFVFDGAMLDLGTLGGAQSVARAINRFDEIVGWSQPSVGDRVAFLRKGNDTIELGTFGTWSDARDVNDAREVVGSSLKMPEVYERAFVWRGNGLIDLGTLGGTEARAFAINEGGEIVGFASNAGGDLRPVLWRGEEVIDLGSLGGWAGHAYDLNENTKIVGWSMKVPNHVSHAFIWSEGSLLDLGTLGGNYSAAFGINESGLVVGTSTRQTGQQAAFMWDGIKMIDLTSRIPANSGWMLISAEAVNEDGRIVGLGNLNGELHAYRLTPDYLLDVSDAPDDPAVQLLNAAPNPLRNSTRVHFTLTGPARVVLDVYDVKGRRVRRLASHEFPAGTSSIQWDARDEQGARVQAGAYWIRLQIPGRQFTHRVSVIP